MFLENTKHDNIQPNNSNMTITLTTLRKTTCGLNDRIRRTR